MIGINGVTNNPLLRLPSPDQLYVKNILITGLVQESLRSNTANCPPLF